MSQAGAGNRQDVAGSDHGFEVDRDFGWVGGTPMISAPLVKISRQVPSHIRRSAAAAVRCTGPPAVFASSVAVAWSRCRGGRVGEHGDVDYDQQRRGGL